MKILILQGSYRKSGNTAHIVEMIRDHMSRLAIENNVAFEAETIHLGHMNIGLCRGCRACFDLGEDKCPLKDDFLSTKVAVQAADGVIIASPVYVDDINGITKLWIDRMAHVCHRPEFAGKTVYLVTTIGSSPSSHSLRSLYLAFLSWGAYIAGQSGFTTGARMPVDELRSRFDGRAEKIARKLFTDIATGQTRKPSFVSLMMFRIYQKVREVNDGSLDARYWHEKGWADPRTKFYLPHNSNPLVVFFARLTGTVIARFVS
jgi:multimeric flavodoxin WrbA